MTELRPFYFAQSSPDRQLSPWFAGYWSFAVRDGAPSVHPLPPDGSTSILVRLGAHERPGLQVSGPWPEPRSIAVHPGEQYFGIRLQPGAAWYLLGVEAASLRGRTIPCDRFLGAFSHRIARLLSECTGLDQAAEVFNRAFLRIADRLELPDALVADAADRIRRSRGTVAISLIALELQASYNTLLRRFREATGLTPSEFAQIQRAREAYRFGEFGTGRPAQAESGERPPSLAGEVGLRLMRGSQPRPSGRGRSS